MLLDKSVLQAKKACAPALGQVFVSPIRLSCPVLVPFYHRFHKPFVYGNAGGFDYLILLSPDGSKRLGRFSMPISSRSSLSMSKYCRLQAPGLNSVPIPSRPAFSTTARQCTGWPPGLGFYQTGSNCPFEGTSPRASVGYRPGHVYRGSKPGTVLYEFTVGLVVAAKLRACFRSHRGNNTPTLKAAAYRLRRRKRSCRPACKVTCLYASPTPVCHIWASA